MMLSFAEIVVKEYRPVLKKPNSPRREEGTSAITAQTSSRIRNIFGASTVARVFAMITGYLKTTCARAQA